MKKRSFFLVVLLSCFVFNAYCNNNNSFNIGIECLGSTTGGFGINAEYSPNTHVDLGIGTILYPFPTIEMHSFARWTIFNYMISPFIEMSGAYMYTAYMDYAAKMEDYFNLRIHLGIKLKFKFGLYLCLSAGYPVYGNTLPQIIPEIPVIPGIDLGWKFKI